MQMSCQKFLFTKFVHIQVLSDTLTSPKFMSLECISAETFSSPADGATASFLQLVFPRWSGGCQYCTDFEMMLSFSSLYREIRV